MASRDLDGARFGAGHPSRKDYIGPLVEGVANRGRSSDGQLTVMVAVCVIATPLAVAETVLVPATVELRVAVMTPLALVAPVAGVRVFPVPVAKIVTEAPVIGVPAASRAVTVIVLKPLPATIEAGDAPTVDCAPETGPAPVTLKAPLVVAVRPVDVACRV